MRERHLGAPGWSMPSDDGRGAATNSPEQFAKAGNQDRDLELVSRWGTSDAALELGNI